MAATNGSPRRHQSQQQPRSSAAKRTFGWRGILVIVALVNYVEVVLYAYVSKAMDGEALSLQLAPPRPPGHDGEIDASSPTKRTHDNLQQRDESDDDPATPSIVLVGMAYTDTSISDFALQFLVDAACGYNMPSHLLLEYRDDKSPLDDKIAALTHHWHPLPRDGKLDRHPACGKLIKVVLSPGKEALLNMTKAYHRQHNPSTLWKNARARNNPLSTGRIARIKRAREYQRGLVREMMSNGDAKRTSAIAVLDLDLFAYPAPSDLIETIQSYMSEGSGDKANTFHAICSNGILVQKSRTWNGYIRRYYDTFSTIFLPNSWIHVDRVVPRGSLVGENVTMAKMNQEKTLSYILSKGRRRQAGEEAEQTPRYDPVPMRSCFSGLALYRSDVWLDPQCRYDSFHEGDARYISKKYQHACEHVVFHECLRRTIAEKEGGDGGGFRIAVKPDMTTLWHG
ncbi:hypothetical protein ACHAXT_008640 [Thalassiosira profunda]